MENEGKKHNENEDKLIVNFDNRNQILICSCIENQEFFSVKQGPDQLENIKRCLKYRILIERALGCAQITCKFCRHCFCFYCLASLDVSFFN
jgi:hypothetical protein